jgi:hypothetical protein
VEKFAEGIRERLLPEAKEKAAGLAKSISAEGGGAETIVNSFPYAPTSRGRALNAMLDIRG